MLEVFVINLLKTLAFVIFTAERTNNPVAGNGFRGHVGNITHGALDTFADLAEALAGIAYNRGNKRPYRQENQREFPVGVEHVTQQTDDGQTFAERDGHGVGCRLRHLLDVKGKLGHQPSRRVVIEIAGRQCHQSIKHIVTERIDDLATDIADEVLAQEGAQPTECEHANDNQRQHQTILLGRILDRRDDIFHGCRHARRCGGIDDVTEYRQREGQQEGLHIGEQAFVGFPAARRQAGRRVW